MPLTEGEITCLSNYAGLPVLRNGFSPSVGFADSSPIRWSQKNGRSPCLPLMRKVAARLVAMTEGEVTYLSNYAGLPVLRNGFSPSVGYTDSSPIRWSQKNGRSPCLPLTRKVAARLVALTEGEITYLSNYAGLPVLRNGFSPSVGFADSSLQQSRAACSPRPARAKPLVSSAALPELCFAKSPVRTIRWSQKNGRSPCLPLTRKVSKPQVLTEGEKTYLSNYAGLPVLRNGFSPSVGYADSSPIRWSQGTKLFRIAA